MIVCLEVKLGVEVDEGSDDDAKLFENKSQVEDKAKHGAYDKSIQNIVNLAQKKVKRCVDIQERKNRRVVKLQEFYFSKAYMVIQIARCLSIARRNFGYWQELIKAQVMSYIYSVPKVRLPTSEKLRNIKSLMLTFNKALWNKLDYEKEWTVRADYKIVRCLAIQEEDDKLDRIEYLQLFNTLLQHHGYKTRFLCAFETKSLEELDFLQVSRTNRMKKNESGGSFLRQRLLAKRKRTKFDMLKDTQTKDFWPSLVKIAKMEEKIHENETFDKIRKQQTENSENAISFLDKFAFSKNATLNIDSEMARSDVPTIHKNLSKSKISPKKMVKKQRNVQSNMFVTNLDDIEEPEESKDDVQPEQDPQEESKAQVELLNSYLHSDDEDANDDKLDYQNSDGNKYDIMKDLCWLEVLNTSTNRWVIVDLFNEGLLHSKLAISNFIEKQSILFLFAIGAYRYQKISGKKAHQLYMRDVTLKYSSYFQQMLAAKNSIYLQDKLIKEIQMIAPYFPNSCVDKHIKKVMESEDKEIYNLERFYVPEKYNGFRSHNHFILESLLGKYQFIRPGSKPFNGLKYKEEDIYLRKDIVTLHTKEQWRRLKREVKPGEKHIRKIKGNYNDKDKMAILFGYWQTRHFENKLNSDGSLPQNEHGNIEIFFDSDVPTGATHVKLRRVRFICKKLEIDYKNALTGFENGANGMSYPVIEGVIILDKDVAKVHETFIKMETERLIREQKKRKLEAKHTWRQLIRKVCVKRYTSRLFDREVEDRVQDIPLSFTKN